ncbi:putative E3 ubiquitin-protein ligase RING1a [Trifolium pratense]|uniref:putative E3 ubiquitin-protein ligase RING1a n=1 Tax=Trifolium pratense TaxID=57577 RepID=UPI00084472C5|nr:putative E3 ubiquitin-protein ligase RING1a [Trifolium pratense]
MPAQKRSFDETLEENEEESENEMNSQDQPNDEDESDQSHSSDSDEEEEKEEDEDEEYVAIKLSEVRKEVQCPICLGIIRKTRTVMECLHRFCRECIDKSMRLGNNECPACRTHCASRRSLRDDPNFDAIIAAIYPDIDKYEAEELALHEDELARHKQFQASIAQTLQRQSEALSKKRNAKATAVAFVRRSQGNYRTSHLRRRRNFRNSGDFQVSNDNKGMNDNDGGKDSSSDDGLTETQPRRCKRGGEQEAQAPQQSASTDPDGVGEENTPEVNRDIISASGTLSWGKNGHRSHNRVNGKNAKSNRISKLVEHLRSSAANDYALPAFIMLVSFDEKRMPSLKDPCLNCEPTMSVNKLCKHVANETALPVGEVELWLVLKPQTSIVHGERTIDPNRDNLRILGDQETLAELMGDYENANYGYLVMAYKRKLQNSDTVGLS